MKWVAIKDEIPPKDTDVLVYGCGMVGIAKRFYSYTRQHGTWWQPPDCASGFECESYYGMQDVTHWAPLPEGPK
jgi:hypothetical protein